MVRPGHGRHACTVGDGGWGGYGRKGQVSTRWDSARRVLYRGSNLSPTGGPADKVALIVFMLLLIRATCVCGAAVCTVLFVLDL